MKFISVFIFLIIFLISPTLKATRHCVILLHGLGRTHQSMIPLENYLKNNGYQVVNQDYPSTKKKIEDIAEDDVAPMVNQCLRSKATDINFVTHSLGAIVLRQYLKIHDVPKLKRIVMLGPPNHGSKIAQMFHHDWLFRHLAGPAGGELTPTRMVVLNRTPTKLPCQIGIIAGDFSLNPLSVFIFAEPNDGIVELSSTHLNNIQDYLVMHVSHAFMRKNTLVMKQALNFLNKGKFKVICNANSS